MRHFAYRVAFCCGTIIWHSSALCRRGSVCRCYADHPEGAGAELRAGPTGHHRQAAGGVRRSRGAGSRTGHHHRSVAPCFVDFACCHGVWRLHISLSCSASDNGRPCVPDAHFLGPDAQIQNPLRPWTHFKIGWTHKNHWRCIHRQFFVKTKKNREEEERR